MNAALLTTQLREEQDVVPTRQRARHLAALFGLTAQQQTALATAVSEIARNALIYGGGAAKVDYAVRDTPSGSLLHVVVSDRGKGIVELQRVLDGQYQSKTGMGLGIIGSRRLCDFFAIESKVGEGTRVELGFYLTQPATPQQIAAVTGALLERQPRTPLEEMQQQNRELLAAMDALHVRQAEVERLNAELAETNRGVMALYAELDEQAASLRRTNEHKTRFLSDMTHELRTPLNAMVSIAHLLLDHADGELNAEQTTQVELIRRSAMNLGELVNDLLDLAKIEAGKTEARVEPFAVADTLATLRGMFRPLFAVTGNTLVVNEPAPSLMMVSDEQKVSQILRNLVSNAMKFTEAGEVRVQTIESRDETDNAMIEFIVSDTGIGIAGEHLEIIFSEFGQIDGQVQRRHKGTGLGLSLTKRLTTLLGGTIAVNSRLGQGTTFTVRLPQVLHQASLHPSSLHRTHPLDPGETTDQTARDGHTAGVHLRGGPVRGELIYGKHIHG